MPCKVCKHPKRSEIEQRIAARALTTVEAAKIVGCHNCTISRHMLRCVAPNVLERLQAEAKEIQSLNVLDQLRQSHQLTLQILDGALSKGDYRLALKTLGVELKQLMFEAKLTGELNESPQVNFLLSPEYVQFKQVIMKALELIQRREGKWLAHYLRRTMKASIYEDLATALDPALFARAAGIDPDEWQQKLLFSTEKRIILNCCRQSGKSTIVALDSLTRRSTLPQRWCWFCLLRCGDPQSYLRRLSFSPRR